MTGLYRIVVGYDYSPNAALALERAFALAAREEQAEVHVVHVLTYMGGSIAVGLDGLSSLVSPSLEAARELEAKSLQQMTAWQERSGETFSRLMTHVRHEQPAREIAQLAADLEADLVVVGTHGRRGLSHLLLGSVAEGVIRLARCPVLVLRPKDVAQEAPAILPPCPACVNTRTSSGGAEFWCEQHRERHGQRHTYHYESRVAQPTNPPLVLR